jgi:hypothetical protein
VAEHGDRFLLGSGYIPNGIILSGAQGFWRPKERTDGSLSQACHSR